MKLEDVKLTVEDPNKEYVVGGSSENLECWYENFYTDGEIDFIGTDTKMIPYSSYIKVDNASYVARIIKRPDEEESYELVSSDPARIIEEQSLNGVFNATRYNGRRIVTHSSNILSTQKTRNKSVPVLGKVRKMAQ